jgi:hypothetical protein
MEPGLRMGLPPAAKTREPWPGWSAAQIVLYAAGDVHDAEIAAKLDTSPALEGRWRRRLAELGRGGSRPNRAPPPAPFPPTQVAAVKAVVWGGRLTMDCRAEPVLAH